MVVYSDLNVAFNENIDELKKVIDKIVQLNYTRIAINIQIDDDNNNSLAISTKLESALKNISLLSKTYKNEGNSKKIDIFSRVTIKSGRKFNFQPFLDKLTDKGCDILAFIPCSQDAFVNACNKFNIDILSFDRETFFGLRMGHHLTTAIVHRQIFVELCYSKMLLNNDLASGNEGFMISLGMHLLRHCRHNKFVISSGSSKTIHLLGVYDVLNLGYACGLKRNESLDAITENCRMVCNHSYTRNHTINGTFEITHLSKITTSESLLLKLKQYNSKNNNEQMVKVSSSPTSDNRKRKM